MVYSIIALVFLGLGYLLNNVVRSINEKIVNEKIVTERNSVFSTVLDNVYTDKVSFVDRVNNTATLSTVLNKIGPVNLILILPDKGTKEDIAIFKDGKCLYTTDLVDEHIVDELLTTINIYFKSELNDNINILGMVFNKQSFENRFGIKEADLKKASQMFTEEDSDVDKIKKRNDKSFNIDEILDKINEKGIQSLTKEEKRFLDNYNG